MWVKRLSTPDQASWKAVPAFFLNWLLGSDTWKCNLSCNEKQQNFPEFSWQILKSWCEVKRIKKKLTDPIEIRRECLWFKKEIRVNKKEVQWDSWHKKGINIVHDIVNIVNAQKYKQNIKLNVIFSNTMP
jgi:hypothetical protein